MVDMKTVLSGLSAFFKAHLYPHLDAVNRAKISTALTAASINPLGAVTLLLCAVLPNTPIENVFGAGKSFGILDDDMKVNPEALVGVAKAYVAELGTYEVDLFGVKMDVTEATMDALAGFVCGR